MLKTMLYQHHWYAKQLIKLCINFFQPCVGCWYLTVKYCYICGDNAAQYLHDDVVKWKHFPRHRPFVWGIHRSSVNSPRKVQWRGALTISLIFAWISGWVNNRGAGDLRRHRAHFDVTVMSNPIANALELVHSDIKLSHWSLQDTGLQINVFSRSSVVPKSL